MIVNELDQAARKRLRLSNKYLCSIATPRCFRTVQFELEEGGFNHLLKIAWDKELNQHVKRLVLRRSRGLWEFPDFDTWEESISLEGSPDSDFDIDDEGDDDGDLMSQDDWLVLSIDKKRTLYHEYEADCLETQARARSITSYLYFRSLGCKQGADAFVHDPAILFDSRWGTRWRRLRISLDEIILHTSYEEDEDIEALQLSYVLRALGWANYFNRNLRSVNLYVGGPAFWGAEPLRRLWDGQEKSTMRSLRLIWGSAAEAYKEAYKEVYFAEDLQAHLLRERYVRQLFIMEYAFNYLTNLDCAVSDEEGQGGLVTTAGALFEFLRRGVSLERVRLAFGRLVDGYLIPGEEDRRQGNGTGELLARLARHAPWPRIKELELELVTDERALVSFLSTLLPTLRRLALCRVTLVSSGGSWESTLRQIADTLRLDSLDLSVLCDYTPAQRIILDPEARVWRAWDAESICYGHYESAVVDHLLGRAAEQPLLEPTAFLRQHIQNCERGKANILQARSTHLASRGAAR